METTTLTALAFYPPAPSNGGALDAQTPPKVGEWVWQPKVKDWRGVVHAPSRTVWNQYGEPSSVEARGKIDFALDFLKHRSLHSDAASWEGFEWFDVGIMENGHDGRDIMRGSLIVFDVMDTPWTHAERRSRLETMFPILPLAHVMLAGAANVRDEVFLINEWRNDPNKTPLFVSPLVLQALLQRENETGGHKFYEGLVAKRRDALYPVCTKPKQKTPLWVKHRFDQP